MYKNQYPSRLFAFLRQHLFILVSLVLVAGLMFAASASTYAQTSPDAQLPDASFVTGSISGTVTNTDGEPVAGMVVIAYRLYSPDLYAMGQWQQYKSAITGDDGQYNLDLLSTGVYRLQASDPNSLYLTQFFGNYTELDESVDIPVSGTDVTGYDFVLNEGGRISGVVTDLAETPLANVTVRAYFRANFEWELVEEIMTNDSGRYMFDALRPGKYIVYFAPEKPCDGYDYYAYPCSNSDETIFYFDMYHDGSTSLEAVTEIDITEGSSITDLDAQLEQAGGIPGSLTFPEEFQSSEWDIVVSVYSSDDDFQSVVSSSYWYYSFGDDELPYNFDYLRPGTYLARIAATDLYYYDGSNAGYLEYYDNTQSIDESIAITVESGQTTKDIDFLIDIPSAPAELRGTVQSTSGLPLEGIEISLVWPCDLDENDYDYIYYENCYNYPQVAGTMVTDAAGNYLFEDISPDTYLVQIKDSSAATHTSQYSDPPTYVGQELVRRLDPAENVLNIVMEEGGAITGSATTWDERTPYSSEITLYKERNSFWEIVSSHQVPDRFALDEDWVTAQDEPLIAGPYPTALYPPGSPVSPLNGFGFSFSGLPEGNYRVGITGSSDSERYEIFYADATEFENATPISVTAGTTTDDIDLIIGEDSATASIEGYVTVDEVPQTGTLVELYEYTRRDEDDYYTDILAWRLLVFTTTDEQGYYRFDGLHQGEYKLRYATPVENELDVYYGGSYSLEDAQVVRLGTNAGTQNVSLGTTDAVTGAQSTEQLIIFTPIAIR